MGFRLAPYKFGVAVTDVFQNPRFEVFFVDFDLDSLILTKTSV
jgi:hypothetical protein